MKKVKQINNLSIYDNTTQIIGRLWRGVSYIVKSPDGRFLEEFRNTQTVVNGELIANGDALEEAIKFCKETLDFKRGKKK